MLAVVCIDVDGTLVGTSNTVDPAVWAAADRLRLAGVRLVLCSGRPAFGRAREYAERLDPDGWHAFQNGASVVHLASGRSRSQPIAPEAVARLIARAAETGRVLELYTDLEYAVERDTDRARRHADLLGVPFVRRTFESLGGSIVRAQWLVAKEDADAISAEPHPGLTITASVSPAMPDSAFLNITATGVDKGLAVRLIAEAYEVPLDRVMMVGDGANDAPAMRLVGWPVAMENAEPEALGAARVVVGHVDRLGLVEALDLAGGDVI